MHNKNKKISEVSRMLDLATFGSKKEKIIKETFNNKVNKSKKIIKENDDDFEFDLDGVFDNDGEGGSLPPDQKDKSNSKLSFPFKIALVAYDLSNMHAALLGLEKDDKLQFGELKSKAIQPNDETGTVEYRPGKFLYPLHSTQEFEKLQKGGRFVIAFKGHEEELDNGETKNTFTWLGGVKGRKDFNLIGMTKLFNLSARGQATLDFLARILSGNPQGEDEELILKYVRGSKSHAAMILKTFYQLASQDIIAIMTGKPSLKDNEELMHFAEEGIAKAIRAIYGGKTPEGTSEEGEKLYKSKYNPNRPVGPFIFEIVKNHVKNEIAKVARYKPNPTIAEKEFSRRKKEAMNAGSNLFIVPSRKSPSNRDNAEKIENEGRIYLYYYDKVQDALEDLIKQAPHMKPYHLRKDERRSLFDSVRHTASPMSSKMDDVAAKDTNPKDSYATEEVKQILGGAVEWMSHDPKKYWISAKNHSETLNSSQESKDEETQKQIFKRKKEAKRNVVNFIYEFLIQMGGAEDVGKSGKGVFLKNWIDDYNEDTFKYYQDKLPNRSEEEVKKFMKKTGIWISGDVQAIYKGVKDYFKENPEEFEKLRFLISDAKTDDVENVNEGQKSVKEKIRAKIRKTLMENLTLNEESNITTDMIQTVGERFTKFLKDDEKVMPEVLNREISDILNTGTGKYHLDSGRFGIMRYITSVLASVFELSSKSEKDNIINYMFSSLFPKGDRSNASIYLIGRISRLDPNKPSDREVIWSAITEPQDGKTIIERALETYNPERASDFISWIMNRISQRAKSLSQKEYSYMHKGETKWKNDASLDEPIGGSGEDGDERTLMSKISDKPADEDKGSKEFAKKMIGAFLGFINKKLEGKKALKEILALFGDERVYNDKGKIDNKLIANILDTSVGAVRKNKNTLMNIIRDSISSGELGKFMKEKVGVSIENYPKIKNFLETGDLVVGNYGSGSSSEKEVEDKYDDEEEEMQDDFMFESFLNNFKKYHKIILK